MERWSETSLPHRILGIQKLETIFRRNGYLICQYTGERIYKLEDMAAVFIPLSEGVDQVMAVHKDHAKVFVTNCLMSILH